MGRKKRQKSITLPKGIFVLRYDEAGDPNAPPSIAVTCEAGRNAAVLHPDSRNSVLTRPGTGLVIRAQAEGTVLLEIFSEYANGSLEATLKCEPINQGFENTQNNVLHDVARSGAAGRQRGAIVVSNDQISLLGHVARLGDTVVGSNEWLAGPSSPSRIEGIEVRWPGKPRDSVLSYGVRLAGDPAGSFRTAEAGGFAGTRGRAAPIVAAKFELSGQASKTQQLVVEALFLSGTPHRVAGHTITVSGPTGQEPLVGLRVMIENLSTVAPAQSMVTARPVTPTQPMAQAQPVILNQSAVVPAQPVNKNVMPEEAPRRVRVFRAG